MCSLKNILRNHDEKKKKWIERNIFATLVKNNNLEKWKLKQNKKKKLKDYDRKPSVKKNDWKQKFLKIIIQKTIILKNNNNKLEKIL